MIIQNILLASESYTYENWVFRDICVGFSRLYYIIDGEGYYEENGQRVRLKKNHLYLTPVKTRFSLYDNSSNKLLHTYCHIVTVPPVDRLIELEVSKNTPLSDAVALWRKYIHTEDRQLLSNVLQFLLLCIDACGEIGKEQPVAKLAKDYIDRLGVAPFCMAELSRALGYTREHITRCFLSSYRTTPKQYYDQSRMHTALNRLMEGRAVCDVAVEMLYATPYSFSKAFKAHFGESPQKYVRTLKTNRAHGDNR